MGGGAGRWGGCEGAALWCSLGGAGCTVLFVHAPALCDSQLFLNRSATVPAHLARVQDYGNPERSGKMQVLAKVLRHWREQGHK